MHRRFLAWCLALLWLLAPPVVAQGLESVLRPGDVIEGHAKWEEDCASCHVRFKREAQDGLCMDCHKDVAQDVRQRAGLHGLQPARACRSCHTDHKGRAAQIAPLDPTRFDHTRTDYVLRGAHVQARCEACHRPERKYREAPQPCQACHREDDVHRGSLGTACADCHTETAWPQTRFDHTKTSFALTGKHADAACNACHKSAVYSEAPKECVACHRADDAAPRGHQGRFGERCDSCHGTQAWKPSRFDHDRDTPYALRGEHRAVTCTACHTGTLGRDKVARDCAGCHRADDKHRGSLGSECQSCHTEARWSEVARFDHSRTAFKLLGGHAGVACASCHRAGAASYRVADTRCVACHRSDDEHRGALGERCESCHVERRWQDTARFDHATSRFPLGGAHRDVTCSACHTDAAYRGTATACVACHRADDEHAGQLGERCESCHRDTRWRDSDFDHAKASFALLGRHQRVPCDSCHRSARFHDAASDCASCHRGDDKHEGRLGSACESCHNARDWRLGRFDHDAGSRFPLDGAHKTLRCESCHRVPAPPGRPIAALGDTCVACHRDADEHDGAFGPRCDTCHVTGSWKQLRRRPS